MSRNSWVLPPGIHNVGSFQTSGIPWITGSNAIGQAQEEKISFPYVTRKVTVIHHGPCSDFRVYFASTASNENVFPGLHYIELGSGEVPAGGSVSSSFSMDIKCNEIYVYNSSSATTSYRVVAELTNIPAERMGSITGSGLTE